MKIRWFAWGMLVAFGIGCSEPNSSVTRSTDDDQFEVTLKAAKNHLKPGEVLPILVTVESLVGQLAETTAATINFVTNQGNVSPSRLDFILLGRDDSLSTGVTTTYTQWVNFTLNARADEGRQADVHALFRDLDTTLKIRIVEE